MNKNNEHLRPGASQAAKRINQGKIRKGAERWRGKNERVRGHKLGKVTATDPNDSMIIAW